MARCGSICDTRLGTKRQAWLGIMFGIIAACIGFPVFELADRLDLQLVFSFLLILPMNVLATVLVVRNSCRGLTMQVAKAFVLGAIFTALLTIGLHYGVKGVKDSHLAVGILLPPWLFVMIPLSIHHLQRPREQLQEQLQAVRVGRIHPRRLSIDRPSPAHIR